MQCIQLIDASTQLMLHVVKYFCILPLSDKIIWNPHCYLGDMRICHYRVSDISGHYQGILECQPLSRQYTGVCLYRDFGCLRHCRENFGICVVVWLTNKYVIIRILLFPPLQEYFVIYPTIGSLFVPPLQRVSWNQYEYGEFVFSVIVGNIYESAPLSRQHVDACKYGVCIFRHYNEYLGIYAVIRATHGCVLRQRFCYFLPLLGISWNLCHYSEFVLFFATIGSTLGFSHYLSYKCVPIQGL